MTFTNFVLIFLAGIHVLSVFCLVHHPWEALSVGFLWLWGSFENLLCFLHHLSWYGFYNSNKKRSLFSVFNTFFCQNGFLKHPYSMLILVFWVGSKSMYFVIADCSIWDLTTFWLQRRKQDYTRLQKVAVMLSAFHIEGLSFRKNTRYDIGMMSWFVK